MNGLHRKVEKIHFEAKHRDSLDATYVMNVIKKTLKDEGSIGIMVTSSGSTFEMINGVPSEALENLKSLLDGTKLLNKETNWSKLDSKLGVGYFLNVDNDGSRKIKAFTFDEKKDGRFILIKLPDLNSGRQYMLTDHIKSEILNLHIT